MPFQHRFDLGRVVYEDAEGVPSKPLDEVDQADARADEPGATRYDQPKGPAGERSGRAEHRGHVRVAADDAVEGDDVGRFELGGPLYEVPVDVSHTVGVAPGLGFGTRGCQVGGRGVSVGAACRATAH